MQRLFSRMVREPFVWFALIGIVIFAIDLRAPDKDTIVVTSAIREALRVDFELRNHRSMSADDEASAVAAWIDEEVLFRTALELRLYTSDIIVRRRLVQRMHFMHEDALQVREPVMTEVDAYIATHPELRAGTTRIDFDHVFLARSKHVHNLADDARRAHEQLQRGESIIGDALPIPLATANASELEVARVFGAASTATIFASQANVWSPPLESGLGVHFIRVRDFKFARTDELARRAASAWKADESKRVQAASIAAARTRFVVTETRVAKE
ncbi:MAG: hypothetical protein H7Z43_05420 [Clostridia bacterium]|nr:hypothetical protein [Deltaproteobacteria bacterium]